MPEFDGDDYQPDRDKPRLTGQIKEVFSLISDQEWHTVRRIAAITGHPEPSVSAQLRNLRKERFGGHTIEREYRGSGLYVFRLAPPNSAVHYNL
jgi:hypothetical protein